MVQGALAEEILLPMKIWNREEAAVTRLVHEGIHGLLQVAIHLTRRRQNGALSGGEILHLAVAYEAQ